MESITAGPIPFSAPNELPYRLLVVDDEPDIRSGLTRILKLEGYLADQAESGYEALSMLKRTHYDLVLLDLRLPGLDGLPVMQRARQSWPDLLMIILTGHATLESAITAAKSDEVVDYLVKPIHNQELVGAVTRALRKRAQHLSQQRLIEAASHLLEITQHPQTSAVTPSKSPAAVSPSQNTPGRYLHVPPLLLDCTERLVIKDGNPNRSVELSKGETAVLFSLMTRPNQVFSCCELVHLAWGDELEETEAASIIRPYISRLRNKLEPNPKEPRLICTVRRRGYRFIPTKK